MLMRRAKCEMEKRNADGKKGKEGGKEDGTTKKGRTSASGFSYTNRRTRP